MLEPIVERYIQLRDAKAKLAAKFKEDAARIDGALVKFEAALLAEFQRIGVESVKTKAGTAFIKTSTAAKVVDWDSTIAWIVENDRFDMLKRDVAKSGVESYKEETGGLPPGIDWREEICVQVRRA